jgi:hypothetical protein
MMMNLSLLINGQLSQPGSSFALLPQFFFALGRLTQFFFALSRFSGGLVGLGLANLVKFKHDGAVGQRKNNKHGQIASPHHQHHEKVIP